MNRVLVFGLSENCGGLEIQVMNYYRYFDHTILQLDFLCYDKPMLFSQEVQALGGRCFVITGRRKDPLANKREIDAFFQEHAHEYIAVWSNLCTLSDVRVLRAAKAFGIERRVIHSHNSRNMGGLLTALLHWKHKRVIGRFATDFWACSKEAAMFFYPRAILNSSYFRIVRNAVDTDAFCFSPEGREEMRRILNIENKYVLGHVGRFHKQKNHEFLLEMFAAVLEQEPHALLLLVGTGELEAVIKSKAKELGVESGICFLGLRNDVPALMQAMDGFVLPSLFEGLPVVGVEAQAAGLKCLFSEAISNEVCLTPFASRLPLEAGAAVWADAILQREVSPAREDGARLVARAGYDIQEQAALLQQWFVETHDRIEK